MKKFDLIRGAAGLSVALCMGAYLPSSVVWGQTVAGPYAAPSPVVYQGEYVDFEEVEVAQGTATPQSADPLVAFQLQLEELQKQTESLRSELDAEKKKNEKKLSSPFSMKVGAQVRFDGVYISENAAAKENFGNVVNSTGVNDVRVTFGGKAYQNLACGLTVRLSNGIAFQDAFIRANDTAFGDVTLGNQYVESGMESVESNSDRAFPSLDEGASFFALRYRLGVSTRLFGAEKKTRTFLGMFLPQSVSSAPNRINLDNSGIVLNARVTATPILTVDSDDFTREALHFGGSYFWLDPASNQNLTLQTAGQLWYSGNSKFLSGTIPLNGASYSVTNVETAYQYEGFAISGEGYFLSVKDMGNAYGATVAARWILTPNCTRSYLVDNGRFGGIKMSEDALFLDVENRTVGSHLGAWEALVKWEWLEANDLKKLSEATYGNVNRSVVAANWFWNEQVVWSLGWEHAFVNSMKTTGSTAKGGFDTLILQGFFKL